MPTIIEKNPDIERDRMAGRLPLKAQRKIERWREQEREGLALAQIDAEQLIELQARKAQASSELAALERADADGKLYREKREADEKVPNGFVTLRERDTARLDAAKAAVDRVNDQIDRLRKRQSQRGRTPLNAVETYLKSLGNVALIEHDGPPAKLSKNENFGDAIERTRASIRDLKDEAAATKLAAIPSTEAKKRALAEIERLASAGRPGTLALLERAGTIRWPVYPLQNVELRDGHIPQIPDTFAFVAWLLKGKLIEAMEAIIDEEADDSGALTDDERVTRLAKIAEQVLAAERTEESLAEQAEAEGFSILRRSDCDPRALLSLSGDLAAPRHL